MIFNEDCIVGMKKLKNNSVNIIIADPPYNIGKDFGNTSDKQEMKKYLEWCEEWIDECLRILKTDGTLYIYGFSEILAYIRVLLEPIGQESKCNVKWIVWHYTNKVVPSLKFWQRSHESILVCNKDSKNKIFNRDDIREDYTQGFLNGSAGKKRPNTKGRFSNGEKETTYTAHTNGALPRDVLKEIVSLEGLPRDVLKGIATLAGGAGKKERVNHPTQKPIKLCERLIKACIKKGEDNLIVIPFCGSGSECVASKKLGIKFISYELNVDYIEIANKRLQELDLNNIINQLEI